MSEAVMDRKEFLRYVRGIGACSCACVLGMSRALAADATGAAPGDATAARAVKRVEFSDQWIRRFMDVLDRTLDEPTRRRVMMSNGKSCFTEWIRSTGREVTTVPFEKWAADLKDRPGDGSVSVEGRVIHFQYDSSAETGGPSPDGVCLCPMVESKPAGLSATYCLCSLGYVKEMHERKFGRPVEVDLLDSVLRGGKRCRFKITVA